MTMTYVNKNTGVFAQHIDTETVPNYPGETKVYVLLSEGEKIRLNGDIFISDWDYAPQGDREYAAAIDQTQSLQNNDFAVALEKSQGTNWSLYSGPIK